jgi:hypothetical protein
MRVPDRRVEPITGSLPQYDWRNKLAQVTMATTTGDLFPIPPQGLISAPQGPSRGGQFPRVTDIVTAEGPPSFASQDQAQQYGVQNQSYYNAGGSSFGLNPSAPTYQRAPIKK